MTLPRALIADDEPLARQRLSRLLQECGWEVVQACCNAAELLAVLAQGVAIDALFLDMEMPGGTGIEALAELPHPLPVIFVTAHPQHAAKAFDVDAVDYLVKPLFRARLEKALEKLDRYLAPQASPLARPRASFSKTSLRFPAKAAGGTFFLDPRKVSHFEFEDHGVWAWIGGKQFKGPWASLSEVAAAFPSLSLLRIQRHLLVRKEAILSLRTIAKGRAAVRLAEGLELEVSRSMTPRVRELLGGGF